MFMVGGGILTHSLPWLLSTVEALAALSLPGLTLGRLCLHCLVALKVNNNSTHEKQDTACQS